MKNCGLERLQARQLSHIDASETFTSCMHYIKTYIINLSTNSTILLSPRREFGGLIAFSKGRRGTRIRKLQIAEENVGG